MDNQKPTTAYTTPWIQNIFIAPEPTEDIFFAPNGGIFVRTTRRPAQIKINPSDGQKPEEITDIADVE